MNWWLILVVVYQAPAPAPGQAAQPVVARIEAVEMEPDRIDRNWGTAVWVKTFTTITKNHDIEWKLLQNRPKSQDDEEPDGEDADDKGRGGRPDTLDEQQILHPPRTSSSSTPAATTRTRRTAPSATTTAIA